MALAFCGINSYSHVTIVGVSWRLSLTLTRVRARISAVEKNNFVVFLPPSEGKAPGGQPKTTWECTAGTFGRSLSAQRELVAAQLRKAKGGDQKLLGVGGAHLERAKESNLHLVGAPCLPAWQRYTGVVWDHLDLESLAAAQRKAFITRIFVPSGLLGLVRADDATPDYRLKIGARLEPFGMMSKWWKKELTEALVVALKGRTIIDLLPNEHRAAVDWSMVPTAVHVDLVAKSGGIVGGHNAKAAKGLLAQHLLLSPESDLRRTVAQFKHLEYSAKVTS